MEGVSITSELNLYPGNPRIHGDGNGLQKSILKYGDLSGVVFNSRNQLLVGGHYRTKTIPKESIIESIPTTDLTGTVAEGTIILPSGHRLNYREVDWDEQTHKEACIIANNPKIQGDWDVDLLGVQLEELHIEMEDFEDFNLDDLAVDFDLEFRTDLSGENKNDPDKLLEEPEKIAIKKGDLIEFGNHRLLCGDSTIKKDIVRLINDQKADMMFTDPPYGADLDTDYTKINKGTKNIKGKEYSPVAGDDIEFNPDHIFKFFPETKEVFLWGADYYIQSLPKNGSLFIWDKRASDKENKYIQENIDRISGNHFEICWSKTRHRKEIIRLMWAGLFGMESDKAYRVHPTQKPLRLCELFIERYSKERKLIVDLYLGSGSTLIACEKTNRKCFGMELDEKYCQIVIERWCQYTEIDEVEINGEKVSWSEYSAA